MKNVVFAMLALFAGAAAAQPRDPCMEAYNAEVTAIERDAKAKQNVGSDAAKQRAARGGQALVDAAGQRAKKCREDATAAGAKPAADDCKARISAHAADIERRFGSETLDPAQQSRRREEEIRLQAELNECNRRTR